MVRLFEKYEYPEGLYYSRDHLWARIENGKAKVGLTDFGQQISGKIRSIRLRPPGRTVERDKTLGTMETGKWVGPLKSPITGTIVENNPVLRRKASLVNEESYGGGWLSVLEPTNLEEDLKNLMTEIDIPWLEKEIVKYVKK